MGRTLGCELGVMRAPRVSSPSNESWEWSDWEYSGIRGESLFGLGTRYDSIDLVNQYLGNRLVEGQFPGRASILTSTLVENLRLHILEIYHLLDAN